MNITTRAALDDDQRLFPHLDPAVQALCDRALERGGRVSVHGCWGDLGAAGWPREAVVELRWDAPPDDALALALWRRGFSLEPDWDAATPPDARTGCSATGRARVCGGPRG